jgi:hypothetical protein
MAAFTLGNNGFQAISAISSLHFIDSLLMTDI